MDIFASVKFHRSVFYSPTSAKELKEERRSWEIGSLSNDNGDGNENIISKYKFALL